MLKNNLPKWTPDRIIFVIIGIFLLAAGIWIYTLSRQLRSARRDAKIQTVIQWRDNTLRADSMRSAIEQNLQASHQAIIDKYEVKLKSLNNENQLLKRKNKAYRFTYDSVIIDRPDF